MTALVETKFDRFATEASAQFQPISLTFQSDSGRLDERIKKLGLRTAGFTEEQSETFKHYDALLFLNFDKPVRTTTGEPYIWNLLISHHLLHFVEILTNQRIIDEPLDEHNHEEAESLQLQQVCCVDRRHR
jgi:hypothetical protein